MVEKSNEPDKAKGNVNEFEVEVKCWWYRGAVHCTGAENPDCKSL